MEDQSPNPAPHLDQASHPLIDYPIVLYPRGSTPQSILSPRRRKILLRSAYGFAALGVLPSGYMAWKLGDPLFGISSVFFLGTSLCCIAMSVFGKAPPKKQILSIEGDHLLVEDRTSGTPQIKTFSLDGTRVEITQKGITLSCSGRHALIGDFLPSQELPEIKAILDSAIEHIGIPARTPEI